MAKLAAGEQKACEACGAKMVGAVYPKTGNVAPLELIPSETGNCLLWRDHETGEPRYAIVADEAARTYLLKDLGVPLRLSHFAACPDAERFRPAAPVES